MVEIHDAVERLESWHTGKAIILHGADHTFCSGGDLNLMKVFVRFFLALVLNLS